MTGSCPGGWYDSGVRCYWVSTIDINYDDSIANCNSQYTGATLATLDSAAEWSFITPYL